MLDYNLTLIYVVVLDFNDDEKFVKFKHRVISSLPNVSPQHCNIIMKSAKCDIYLAWIKLKNVWLL